MKTSRKTQKARRPRAVASNGPKVARQVQRDKDGDAAKLIQEHAPLWADFSVAELATLAAILTGERFATNSRRDAMAKFIPAAIRTKLDVEKARAILAKAKTPTVAPAAPAKNGKSKQLRPKQDPVRRAEAKIAKVKTPRKSSTGKSPPAKVKPAKAAPNAHRTPSASMAAIVEAAKAGKLPTPPDFSAPSRERYRAKLAEVVKLAKAGDVKALRAVEINPSCSGPAAIARYRDLCVVALTAKGRS